MLPVDRATGSDRLASANDRLELRDVARPLHVLEQRSSAGGEARVAPTGLVHARVQDRVCERLHVVEPLVQTRHHDRERVQAVEQVLTERAARDQLRDVRRGRRDQAHQRRSARARALLEVLDQHGLGVRGQLVDRLEHQRGLGAVLDGLAELVRGQRGAVLHDDGLPGATTLEVHYACGQRLAGAYRAFDQHGRVTLRCAVNGALQTTHHRRVADERFAASQAFDEVLQGFQPRAAGGELGGEREQTLQGVAVERGALADGEDRRFDRRRHVTCERLVAEDDVQRTVGLVLCQLSPAGVDRRLVPSLRDRFGQRLAAPRRNQTDPRCGADRVLLPNQCNRHALSQEGIGIPNRANEGGLRFGVGITPYG